jgi:hypothetical protein
MQERAWRGRRRYLTLVCAAWSPIEFNSSFEAVAGMSVLQGTKSAGPLNRHRA